MKNRILFLSNAYPDFDSSYRGIFIKKMAALLSQEGYRISVVTPKIYKGSRYFEDQEGIKVYRFPFFSRGKLLIEHKRIPYLRMILYYISGSFLAGYVVWRNRCNAVHVHWAIPTGPIGVLAGWVLRKPLIVTIHGSDFRMALEGTSLMRKIFLFVCKKASRITCVSNVMKKEMERLGVESEKISVFPMGVEEAFLETGKKREAPLKNGHATVLSNRNLLPIYNVSQLIQAIPIVLKEEPGTYFLIAGEGSEREALEQEAKRLNVGPSVQFLGRVVPARMPEILAETDVFISTSPYDGTSVSLLEAMASGAFPIVTDIPANREWILDGHNGLLVPVGDGIALSRKIIKAIRDKKQMDIAGKINRQLVKEKASWHTNIIKISEVYQSVSVF